MTDAVEKVVLLPCPNPWCEAGEREGDFRPHIHYSNFGLVYVACTSCRMAGPTRNHEAEAIAAWNHRTPPDDSVARIVAYLRNHADQLEKMDGYYSPNALRDIAKAFELGAWK